MTIGPGPDVKVSRIPSRRAKPYISGLVGRADPLGEMTVSTTPGRPAAVAPPASVPGLAIARAGT